MGPIFTAWADFRRNLGGILLLAIGAVAFTTLVVGLVARWIVPDLPWAACFALGAVVSPPDAIPLPLLSKNPETPSPFA